MTDVGRPAPTGDFRHIPACRTASSLHCVIAFSTFDAPPPANTMFGVSGTPAESVLCTNPARLSGGGDELSPICPSAPFAPGTLLAGGIALLDLNLPAVSTPWISAPDSDTARCTSGPGPHLLLVSPRLGRATSIGWAPNIRRVSRGRLMRGAVADDLHRNLTHSP